MMNSKHMEAMPDGFYWYRSTPTAEWKPVQKTGDQIWHLGTEAYNFLGVDTIDGEFDGPFHKR